MVALLTVKEVNPQFISFDPVKQPDLWALYALAIFGRLFAPTRDIHVEVV